MNAKWLMASLAALIATAFILFVSTALMVTSPSTESQAANLYAIASGQTVTINEHGICRKVRNNTGASMMVPTRTSTEWSQFISRAAGVTITSCCSGVGGYCWYLGSSGQDCDMVCASRGGVNMDGTRNYAGSGGTSGNCLSVMASLGVSTSYINTSSGCQEGWGCLVYNYYGSLPQTGASKFAALGPKSNLMTKADFGSSSCGGSLSCSDGDDGGSSSPPTVIRCASPETQTWSDISMYRRACACNN